LRRCPSLVGGRPAKPVIHLDLGGSKYGRHICLPYDIPPRRVYLFKIYFIKKFHNL